MAAEQALIDIAQMLKKRMAKYDVIARFGEDEFSVILPGEGKESARFVARNIKRAVDGLAIQGQNGKRKLTVSTGVVATVKDDSDTFHKLTGRALTAMQESKTEGGTSEKLVERRLFLTMLMMMDWARGVVVSAICLRTSSSDREFRDLKNSCRTSSRSLPAPSSS